ncbi:mannose-1-phosphate guanylyltransferase [Echinicola marina]|uniref:mannose-1-phosphate guanylyltransferase n=1 Tax=Echinicola marina TaxID=2859768 RepID=UPI001CF6DBDE|nr:mannose-1-phosphate guanylyltransferase [Echinicola marina]UCS93988.1 mannose-1-phosphate guanylyltransferase [Echinicola marina]
MKIFNLILSGGVGSRLWPLSRVSYPKQYLSLFGGESLFQKTVQRNKELVDGLLVVGNRMNYELSRNDLRQLGVSGYLELVEAVPRNTAAAIAFAAFSMDPDDILFVTPSDHLITGQEAYKKAVYEAFEMAKDGALVTFGVKPDRPETGYGYIEAMGSKVLSFREKPNESTAKQFIKQGNFYWNSGMFCFQASVFLKALFQHEPEIFERSLKTYNEKEGIFMNRELSEMIPAKSVDYAVMEKDEHIKVVHAGFQWSDMGSFEAVYDYLKTQGHPVDENGNMVIGSDLHTEFAGFQNSILVVTDQAMLVLQKELSQQVKDIFEKLAHKAPVLVQ